MAANSQSLKTTESEFTPHSDTKFYTSAAIQTQELSVGYSAPLAEHLSFEIGEGEFIALIGRNGSGKSTFLKTLAGLVKPLNGSIFITGTDRQSCDISKIPPLQLAKTIAFVPSQVSIETDIKVFDFVSLGRSPHTNCFDKLTAHDLEIVQNALNSTETAQFSNRRIRLLSDGERQRVSLARALAQETQILLLDEPTAFLDYPSRINLFNFLTKLTKINSSLLYDNTTPQSTLKNRQPASPASPARSALPVPLKTVIISTHELDLAKRFSQKILQFKGNGAATISNAQDALIEWA